MGHRTSIKNPRLSRIFVLLHNSIISDLLLRRIAAVQLAQLERLRNNRLFHRVVTVPENVLFALGRPVVFLGAVLHAFANHQPHGLVLVPVFR